MRLLFDLVPSLDQWLLHRKRLHMMRQMYWEISSGLEHVDHLFGHDQYWVPPETEGLILDGRGHLIVHVRPKFHGKDLHYWFSVWQVGNQFKMAVILEGDTAMAPVLEGQNEIETIFHDVKTELHDRKGIPMYQWTWDVDRMYDSWFHREKHVRNFRHLYYRMCRIVHDGTS